MLVFIKMFSARLPRQLFQATGHDPALPKQEACDNSSDNEYSVYMHDRTTAQLFYLFLS